MTAFMLVNRLIPFSQKEVFTDLLEKKETPSEEEAFVTSNVILEGFREGGSMEVLKARQRRKDAGVVLQALC